jgi:signal transduction histidine kinase
VLCGGFYMMYRLGAGQIDLTRQQQDFVSAVSHELKTPLTSIRMYGEILREGWASDEKKKLYYDYIFEESERLSRLIANVLQLARMTRNHTRVETRPLAVAELMDGIRSRVSAQVARARFDLNMHCDPEAGRTTIQVDPDGFLQIFINLVDNAIKFSATAQQKVIDIGCERLRDGRVQFGVRDYGPGVPGDQMKKIFRLFYRSESELTRETVGTGIGLALVHQLARAMDAQVDVVNREPGAEFRLKIDAINEGRPTIVPST